MPVRVNLPVSENGLTRVRPAQKPVFTDPTEDQPPSFPCAKRQLSIVSILKRQSLPT